MQEKQLLPVCQSNSQCDDVRALGMVGILLPQCSYTAACLHDPQLLQVLGKVVPAPLPMSVLGKRSNPPPCFRSLLQPTRHACCNCIDASDGWLVCLSLRNVHPAMSRSGGEKL
jgi:hypothetical protein